MERIPVITNIQRGVSTLKIGRGYTIENAPCSVVDQHGLRGEVSDLSPRSLGGRWVTVTWVDPAPHNYQYAILPVGDKPVEAAAKNVYENLVNKAEVKNAGHSIDDVDVATRVVLAERWAKLDDWRVLTEVRDESFHPGLTAHSDPVVRVLQHRGTKEICIDVFDCKDGLDVTYTNGHVREGDKKRATWFRDIMTCRNGLRRLRVRFMAQGSADNLELRS